MAQTLASLCAVLLLSTLSSAMPAMPLAERGTVLPSDDSFYAVPKNISAYAPGEIIGFRKPPAPIAAFTVDPVNLDGAWQIHYRTTDALGAATSTVLTVLIPYNADYTKVLSYQVAEDAASINCAPSYALQLASATSGFLGTLVTQAELLLVEAGLEQGWVVILPDHEGPNGAWLSNLLAGHATLDGIRAALASTAFTGIQADAKVGMWGYSGGSLASGWTAELQPSYAPELLLNLVGAAVGGNVPNISNVITTVDGTLFAGLMPPGMMGLAAQYPYIQETVNAHVLPQFQAAFAKTRHQCFAPDILDFLLADVAAMADIPSIFTSPEIMAILNANALGSRVPAIPLYVYKSVLDNVSPIADTDKMVKTYCAAGAHVHYVRDLVSDHAIAAVTGAPRALAWLIDAMKGKVQTSCKTETTISLLLDISTIEVVPGFLVEALLNLIGDGVGPAFFG